MTINRSTENGQIRFAFEGTNHAFHMPVFEGLELEPRGSFEHALNAFASLVSDQRKILDDDSLSTVGRERKLTPVQSTAIHAVATSWGSVGEYEGRLAKREEILLAVPQVGESNTATAIQDREIRDWWRGMDTQERAKYIHAFNEGPEYQRIELALLRSPIALVDWEIKAVRESWNRAKRMENPGEAVAIDQGKASVEWARRGLAQLGALTASLTKWEHPRILESLIGGNNEFAQNGHAAFGFGRGDVEAAKRALQARNHMHAA